MKAIILAAGIGSRLRPLTETSHKSLLPVAEKTMLERMLENIAKNGIRDVAIVTGYRENDIRDFAQTYPGLAVSFIHNDQYLNTNTGYSLLLTKEFAAGDDFVKFDADVVFEPEVLEKLLTSPHATCLCIDKNIHLDKEEVKVIADGTDAVIAVGKKLDPHKSRGESIGIEKIGAEAGIVLFEELERLMQDPANHQEYYDDSYTTLVEKGIPFHAVDITGMKWVETDTHDDYARAQVLFKNS
ncbi:MAG: phosphocholine cytidylyltransferase family protein [Patescibacteria group bacterium]